MTEPTQPPPGAVIEVDPLATELGERFDTAGHQLYLVGGSVRDLVSGRDNPDADLDFCTDAAPHETTQLLRGWADRRYLVGVKFGTVGALKRDRRLEITTFREDVYAREDRKPVVTFAKDVETDLSRRDFTINAMAVRLPGGAFVDPFGGVRHLATKTLDTPREPEMAFSDDPLRMLRAARFMAQLGVQPAPRVVDAIREMRSRLSIVSAERIADELSKLLVAERPSAGLELLVDTGLADEFIPEIPALKLEQDPVHRHKDVLRHTYAVIESCEPKEVLRLAALLHDVGKPATREITPDGVQFHHHEVVGARMTRERMRALKYSNEMVDDVSQLVFLHLRFHTYQMGWTDAAVRRFVRDCGPLLAELIELTRCDCTTRNKRKAEMLSRRMDELEERIERLGAEEELRKIRPDLDGTEVMAHLGIGPGRDVGDAMAFLLELRLDDGPMARDAVLERLDAWWADRSGPV